MLHGEERGGAGMGGISKDGLPEMGILPETGLLSVGTCYPALLHIRPGGRATVQYSRTCRVIPWHRFVEW